MGQLLSHQSGVCGLRETVTVTDLYDWSAMVKRMAAEEPFWEPGTAAGYHAVLWGYLPGELALRTSGKTLGAILAERIARPLGAEVHLGLQRRNTAALPISWARITPASSPISVRCSRSRCRRCIGTRCRIRRSGRGRTLAARHGARAEIAAANAQANARGIARIYGALARGGELDGVRVLNEDTIAAMCDEEVGEQDDLVLGRPLRRGRGVILNTQGMYGPNREAYGHSGAGGSVGFADPSLKLGIGYADESDAARHRDRYARQSPDQCGVRSAGMRETRS